MTVDFQAVVDGMEAMTCVVSVERLEDGSYGEVRLVAGNAPYIASIEQPAPGAQMLSQKFVPNSLYTDYLTRDLNFEEYCYKAAVHKKCLHSYAHPERMNVWFNMTFLPLAADEGNVSYCTYTMEINFEPDSERLSNVSSEYASQVLGMSIMLRSSDDFEGAMGTVAESVRDLCDAEYCGILLVDEGERTCEMLAEDKAEGSLLLPMKAHMGDGFYEIVESWADAIAGSNCIIAKNEHDMNVVKERNPRWYESLTNASVYNIVLFPLKSHGSLLGYIWAVNFDSENSTRIKEGLELATYVLACEIDNYLLVKRLRELSSRDMLTGVFNRNEMDARLNRLAKGAEAEGLPIGVVFADLNGLKAVNDTKGHAAGDQLLKAGASALIEVFELDNIYRAGGDEFVMLEPGITERELADKVETLKHVENSYGQVSFAVGSAYEADAKDVRSALKLADKLMYKDKHGHYCRK